MAVATRATTLEGLDVRHLRALLAVVEHGTFASAAEALGFTQSAVSQQIASLERLVGERLFDRPGGPKPVTLTAAGRMVLRHAERIIEQVAVFERDLNGHKSGTVGRIEVGVFQSVAVKVLPAVVGRLRRETIRKRSSGSSRGNWISVSPRARCRSPRGSSPSRSCRIRSSSSLLRITIFPTSSR